MMITVYSKPDCVQCNATYRALNKLGISYQVIDLNENEKALACVKSLGYQQIPVLIVEGDHWSGFRPDKINALGQNIATY